MSKGLIYIAIFVGGTIGSYIPVLLFHQDYFSIASILFGAIGSLVGICVAVKLSA